MWRLGASCLGGKAGEAPFRHRTGIVSRGQGVPGEGLGWGRVCSLRSQLLTFPPLVGTRHHSAYDLLRCLNPLARSRAERLMERWSGSMGRGLSDLRRLKRGGEASDGGEEFEIGVGGRGCGGRKSGSAGEAMSVDWEWMRSKGVERGAGEMRCRFGDPPPAPLPRCRCFSFALYPPVMSSISMSPQARWMHKELLWEWRMRCWV